jgi:Flp pilus assembly protein TadB
VTMDVALGRRVEEPQSLKPEVESLRQAQAQLLAPLRGGAAWTESLEPLCKAAQRKKRWAWLWLVLGVGGAVVGGILQLPWLLAAGGAVILLALGMFWWQRRSLARNFTQTWTKLATEASERVPAAAHAAAQDWLQRAFQAFSANYRPLLEACEMTRTQQEASQNEVEAMRQNFAELTKQLMSP